MAKFSPSSICPTCSNKSKKTWAKNKTASWCRFALCICYINFCRAACADCLRKKRGLPLLLSHKDELWETEAIGREGRTVSAVRPFRFAKGSVNLNILLRAVRLSVHATPRLLKSVSDVHPKIPLFLRRWLCPGNDRPFPIHCPAWSRCAWSKCRSVAHPRFSFVTGARE